MLMVCWKVWLRALPYLKPPRRKQAPKGSNTGLNRGKTLEEFCNAQSFRQDPCRPQQLPENQCILPWSRKPGAVVNKCFIYGTITSGQGDAAFANHAYPGVVESHKNFARSERQFITMENLADAGMKGVFVDRPHGCDRRCGR